VVGGTDYGVREAGWVDILVLEGGLDWRTKRVEMVLPGCSFSWSYSEEPPGCVFYGGVRYDVGTSLYINVENVYMFAKLRTTEHCEDIQ